MTVIKPFKGTRPAAKFVETIGALPYDVYNRLEAREVVKNNPLSFLQIDRGETLLDKDVDIYSDQVYQAAKNRFDEMISNGEFIKDNEDVYYIYELTRFGKTQRGLVGLVQAKDYEAGTIKKHENTREKKENDRVNHIETLKAHTGPIFLTYKNTQIIQNHINTVVASAEVIFEFTGDDQVTHKGYKVTSKESKDIILEASKGIDCLYIADGHHRAAAASKVAKINNYDGEAGDFLGVIFPDNELTILDYNRVVKDLNGLSKEEFLTRISQDFDIQEVDKGESPSDKASYEMFLDGCWYHLSFNKLSVVEGDPVKSLDVSILQEFLLDPVLGVEDPRTSERIGFVGGIRGLAELERRVKEDMTVAFALKPTSITELIDVSDQDLLMPPKSTWFEPKLKSGLFIHQF